PRISVPVILRSAAKTASAPARRVFRGSITHPTQQLCTLRGRRCLRLTQHSPPGDSLRLTWTGLAPAHPASLLPPPFPTLRPDPSLPHHHVCPADLVAGWRFGDTRHIDTDRDVENFIVVLDKEVVVVGGVGIEVGLGTVDGDLAEKPGLGELMQRVVDRGER